MIAQVSDVGWRQLIVLAKAVTDFISGAVEIDKFHLFGARISGVEFFWGYT